MKKVFLLGLALVVFLLPENLLAVPAYPGKINFKQPDGSSLTIRLFGDENLHRAETIDGYTILFNGSGFYEYATIDSHGELICSGIPTNNIPERIADEINFLSGINKSLKYSHDQINILKQISAIYNAESQRSFPTTGNRKLVCILIEFTDLTFTKTQSEFDNLFNQIGYSVDSATGSIKDFYLENSWDQLTLNVTVAGPYTAAHNMAYYGNNYDGDDRALITEAVYLADADINYTDFDNDNDGNVDSMYVIFAGYGEEAGASPDAIWSHKWNISPVTLDGTTISLYSCSPELRGNSGTGITRIGVICHEFGHALGAPDYYDTNYSTGGSYTGTGSWDVMAGGSWNNNGTTPAHHNGFTKWYYYNWFSPVELTSTQAVTVQDIKDNKSAYYYSTASTNEYWFLENRQQIGFDANLPGHGLIIYHVDQDEVDAHDPYNNINATHPQYMYPVCANASANPPDYGSINSSGTPFPGSSNVTAFTDTTTPASIDWQGNPTNKSITNILENSGVINFMFEFDLETCFKKRDCNIGDYCSKEACEDPLGTCSTRPTGCSTDYDPVCSCTGITYLNSCVAAKNGRSVDYEGVCATIPCGTDGDDICDDGDNSGTAGDNPCTGGDTTSCDDNCPSICNSDQLDADGDGIGDVCDQPDDGCDGCGFGTICEVEC